MSADLENMILSLIDRYMGGRYSERHGLVVSYDPKKHLAKVTYMPEGQESGWLPIETSHIGDGYGILSGLQPGKGSVSDKGEGGQAGPMTQNQGDQVIVRFQEGDFESGKIVQRVHSDHDKPPEVQSGELMFYTKFQKSGGTTPDAAAGGQGGTGQQVYFKKDGSLSLTDGNGASLICDGKGNVLIKCKNLQIDASGTITQIASGDVGIQGGGNVVVNAGGKTGINAGGPVVVKAGGSVADGAVTPPNDAPATDPFKVP